MRGLKKLEITFHFTLKRFLILLRILIIKTKTSNNTLANLPAVDEKSLEKVLQLREKLHKEEKEELTKKYEQEFPMWKFELQEGFNLLLMGYGSKRRFVIYTFSNEICRLLNLFASQYLHQYLCIRLNGYIPNLQIKSVRFTQLPKLIPTRFSKA